MSIFKALFSKKKPPAPLSYPTPVSAPTHTPEPKLSLDDAQLKAVVDDIKQNHGIPACHIVTIKNQKTGLTQSKFGGRPYWPSHMEYPKTPSGEALLLLAQINFSELPFLMEPLPRTGLLQFYVANDDLCGLGFDDQTVQTGFRVVFHPNPTDSITEADLIARHIPTNEGNPDICDFPFYKEIAIRFESMTDFPNASNEDFDQILTEALSRVTGLQLDKAPWKALSSESYDKIAELLSSSGHHMLGYPFFTQADPRRTDSPYDTLLFQMDSEMPEILWGDCGVCHFFINKNDIKKQDFSKVLYNWDCY